ncbi:hypothetical protein [Cerasicoccus arenae]|nr:hypothetical protein [Cerasicoccus arenae]MBK1858883.1 hypothetical protein [Cerasicoccus arenae]
MKHATLLSLLGLFCLLIASGCNTLRGKSSVEDYNADPLTVQAPNGVTDTAVQDVMYRALTGRQWKIIESSPNKVVGTLDHRGFKAKVTLVHEGNQIKIFSDSTYYSTKRKGYYPAVPYGWLENLQKDMNNMLARSTY